MDAFVGKWTAGPGDFENLEQYVKDLKLPDLVKIYEKGLTMTIAKEGDNYSVASSVEGTDIYKQIFFPGGEVQMVIPPGIESEFKYRFEDNKLIVEGNFSEKQTKVTEWIEDGKCIVKHQSNDAWMTTTFHKV